MSGDGALLRVRNLESFYGPVMALRGVSLDVPQRRIVAVLGANGAGKTTLLRTISGVMDPEKGEVLLAGESIAGGEPDRIVRKGIVHVPEGREVFPLLTVAENLAMGAYTRSDAGVEKDLEMVLGYFPVLKERLRQTAGTLSGGEQQMLAIARGLMARPKIMLLDEPSLGLSPILIRDIYSIIRRLNEERGGRHAAGGAERQGRARRRRSRLCDGGRANRDGRPRRTARAEPGHPGVLPGRTGAELARREALEAPEDLEITHRSDAPATRRTHPDRLRQSGEPAHHPCRHPCGPIIRRYSALYQYDARRRGILGSRRQ